MVVIDDTIAFSAGLDLTGSRWDTPDHEPDDPRRLNRKGSPYAPFHDVQIVVDDEAARALGVLARERWWRATGQRIPEVVRSETRSPSRPWPTGSPGIFPIRGSRLLAQNLATTGGPRCER